MAPTLDSYIAELLYDYDCVVIPQFGGFVTSYHPAKVDVQKGLAEPPRKEIRFNRNLTKNDGLLTTACADARVWSFEEADAYIKKEVQQYWETLHNGSKLKLKKVGILYIDAHKNLRFEPDLRYNFLKQSWGFESFALPKPVIQAEGSTEAEVIQMRPAEDPAEATLHDQVKVPKKTESPAPLPEIEANQAVNRSEHTRSVLWVAAATLLPFIAFSFYLGAKTGFKSPSAYTAADLNPFSGKQVERRYAPLPLSAENDAARSGNSSIGAFPQDKTLFPYSFTKGRVDSTGVWINLAKTEKPLLSESAHAHTGFGKYHLIGGCFGEKSNADRFIAQMQEQGFEAYLLDYHKGLHRVSLKNFNDYQAATEALREMRDAKAFNGVWMLKKSMKR